MKDLEKNKEYFDRERNMCPEGYCNFFEEKDQSTGVIYKVCKRCGKKEILHYNV